MMNLVTVAPTATTYASTKNARYSSTKSNIRTIKQRWDETYNSHPNKFLIDYTLESAKNEFRRRYPNLVSWNDLALAEAKDAVLIDIKIDGTMQRQLNIFWVLELLTKFCATAVVPIQVYRPNPDKDEYLAWDGQHTLVLLWLIATQIFEADPSTIRVPVNVYKSSLKAEMRANFITLNSKEGKKQLEPIDIFEQQVFGVRVDKSKNPIWIDAELKQQYIEQAGLFVTAKKFGDEDQPGAISRLQEINKLEPESVEHLTKYLAIVSQLQRPIAEKEMVMMAHYFDRCRLAGIDVTPKYIFDLANVATTLWDADFTPTGKFWTKASNAYGNWHSATQSFSITARFNKEPIHGFPFLIAQLNKSFVPLGHAVPRSDSNSSFVPATKDLF